MSVLSPVRLAYVCSFRHKISRNTKYAPSTSPSRAVLPTGRARLSKRRAPVNVQQLVCRATVEEGKEGEESTDVVTTGSVSKYLAKLGLRHKSLGFDYSGVEIVQATREDLLPVCAALYADGWNYLRNSCGYDSEPGGDLVSVIHIAKMDPNTNDATPAPEEVCIKCFLPRNDPRCPTVYWIWQTADWQERETYDMYGIIYEGHPHLTRILMPEHWEGWPLRKDYITPDFYELQDAY